MQPMEDMVMAKVPYKTALIAGVGPGISASRASSFGACCGSWPGCSRCRRLKGLADETGAKTFAVDASNPSAVARLFLDIERLLAEPGVVIYNASSRVSGKLRRL